MKLQAPLLLLFVSFYLTSHEQTRRAYEIKAETAFQHLNFSSALAYYNVLLEIDPNRLDARYYAAESARRINAFQTAASHYNRIPQEDRKGDFKYTDFWLGMVMKNLEHYEEASRSFVRFLDDQGQQQNAFTERAKSELIYCDWAAQSLLKKSETQVNALDTTLNSFFSDLAPVQVGDHFYYTTAWFPKPGADPVTRVFESVQNEPGKVLEGMTLTPDQYVANIAFSTKGNRMYYTLCDKKKGINQFMSAIYVRTKESDGCWGNPQKLSENVNQTGFNSTHPNIAMDSLSGKERLFFASDRPGGKGKMDLWYSLLDEDGTPGKPVNLENLNTTDDEVTPFFHSPTQTLFFSSNGQKGMGGMDILKAKAEGSHWSAPENPGAPLNSGYDDVYYGFYSESGTGYFSSNRPGSRCATPSKDCHCNDLYKVQINTDLIVFTFNDYKKDPLQGTVVTLTDLDSGKTDSISNLEGNDFHFPLAFNKRYRIIGNKDMYTSDTLYFDTRGLVNSTTFNKQLFLRPEVRLDVTVYDALNKMPLDSSIISLDDLSNKSLNRLRLNPDGNDFHFQLRFDQSYVIAAKREGYGPDTLHFNTNQIKEPTIIKKDIYLARYVDLPLALYFDNDWPNPKTRDSITSFTFGETVDYYMQQRARFLTEYTTGLSGEPLYKATRDINLFFDTIQIAYQKLNNFSELLYGYLKGGFELEIILDGYASPLAKSDYNQQLTKRRIDCVINHFENWNNGLIKPYLDSRSLVIREIAHGEEDAPKDVTDDYRNRRESIFSIKASKERRVRIIDVKRQAGILSLKYEGKTDF